MKSINEYLVIEEVSSSYSMFDFVFSIENQFWTKKNRIFK